ncbi:DUF4275 family protein [Clostridium tagluense]|uniref:DUF4275 family protein n=1 Tax=Clostridium tagluense TaxID=360422 RepID=UPI001C0BD986|nr:DUF4275 family protein [Clostridium tagluense]MBU3130643.1 DUF4275 family protein [Clostridium tagluense]
MPRGWHQRIKYRVTWKGISNGSFFSFKRLIATTGADAKDCLDKVNSNTLYVFLNDANVYGKDICYRIENATAFNHEMIQCYSDVYITEEDFTWTYVRTHED